MKATQNLLRPAILLCSIGLIGGYIWYNASQASRLPEPVADSKHNPAIEELPVGGTVSPAQNNTTSTITIMPGSKFAVLPGSKSMPIVLDQLVNYEPPFVPTPPADQKPATSPPMGDQKPAQSPPPTPEGKK